jgi:ankyrin repeat protein
VVEETEPDEYTVRAIDFILRTHALQSPWPAPLLATDGRARALAVQCMSVFGRQAHYASIEPPQGDIPKRALRTVTRLHFAAMRGDVASVGTALDEGIPVDVKDLFGFTAIHYVKDTGPLLELLLERGAKLDDETHEGATLLMLAVQSRSADFVRALLARGASADRADHRGFTALHRAAEMGELAIVEALLAAGADPDREADGGFTPRSLATSRKHSAILDRLAARS